MTLLRRKAFLIFTLLALPAVGQSVQSDVPAKDAAVPQAIFKYVERDEPDYAWTIDESIENEKGAIHQATLVSQKWHDVTWKHDLYVYEPKVVRHPTKVLLFITGGSTGRKPDRNSMNIGQTLAKRRRRAGRGIASGPEPTAVRWSLRRRRDHRDMASLSGVGR